MDNNTLLEFDYKPTATSIIKVIGVGGGGGNAVQHMYREGIHDVTFVLCNTDNQALQESDIPIRLQLGKKTTKGLGAGNDPLVAKKAAEESAEDIKQLLDDGSTEMVFVTAGMGGGTGTGAAPVIAKIAKEMGILTVGIVTIPFVFEDREKILQALNGVEEMSKNVDALLVINNERLIDLYPNLPMWDSFAKADDTLTVAAKSIAETITLPGYINLDFADVRKILKDGGVAIMSSGIASGEDRIARAIENALHSPLVNNNNVSEAKKFLFNIYSSKSVPLYTWEMKEMNNFKAKFKTKGIEVIWGAAIDESLGENVKVTVLATGFGLKKNAMMEEVAQEEAEKREKEITKLIEEYYPVEHINRINEGIVSPKSKPYIFSLEELDDDSVIDFVINNPAYNRNSKVFTKDTKFSETVEPEKEEQPETAPVEEPVEESESTQNMIDF